MLPEPKGKEELAESIREGKMLLVDLRGMEKEPGQSLLDFLCGVAFANRGVVTRVAGGIFVAAPRKTMIEEWEEEYVAGSDDSPDIESKAFSRGMRGYAMDEVDEFLDRVAEDVQEYSIRCNELARKIDRLEEQIKEYDNLKETLQGTLLMAQKSAEAKEEAAKRQAENTISEAKLRADQIISEAVAVKDRERREIQRLRQLRQEFKAEFRALLSKFSSLADGDEEARPEEDEISR